MTNAACTFTPLKRNRLRCNHPDCHTANGGPVVVKRAAVENHRNAKFNERNPRSETTLPPLPWQSNPWVRSTPMFNRQRDQRMTSSTLVSSAPLKRITLFADSWLCPACFERNFFDDGYGCHGTIGTSQCGDCGRTYMIERVG